MFCPKCSAILTPKKRGKRVVFSCNCGYFSKKKEDLVLKEKIHLKKENQIKVIDKKIETLPKTEEECPKCHHREAYYWLVQTRSGDESATRFFKCVKCNHTWRSYT